MEGQGIDDKIYKPDHLRPSEPQPTGPEARDSNTAKDRGCWHEPRISNSRLTKADRFIELIDAAMKPREEAPREYLGASAIGETCARRLQYEFQGAPKDEGSEFSPKTLRIFHRGHIGEDWMAEWIRKAGFDLRTERTASNWL